MTLKGRRTDFDVMAFTMRNLDKHEGRVTYASFISFYLYCFSISYTRVHITQGLARDSLLCWSVLEYKSSPPGWFYLLDTYAILS